MSDFNKEFEKLNKAQKQAVETTSGPVLVIAGPGTGKTQLLSMRVANILRSSDTDPKRILCLTFTNKAANNMRGRLLSLAGELARHVQVKTFHSFAAELINQYPDDFWRGARLQIAPGAVQAKIIQSILSKLPAKNPLAARFAGRFTALEEVNSALQLAKEAGLTPAKLKALTSANLAYIDSIEGQFADIVSPTLNAKSLAKLQKSIEMLPPQGVEGFTAPFQNLDRSIKESLATAIAADEGTGKTKHTGAWKARFLQAIDGRKGMFDERKRNEWWLAVSYAYASYRKLMHQRGHYDYADMLVEVLSQLDRKTELLARVQEHYEYVLVDEFQDSNAAQLRLAHLVADHPESEGKPNIMAVGDDDQSIFGFNGAELGAMLFFDKAFSDVKKIVLRENYRSSQQILDTASKIIDQCEDRLIYHDSSLKKDLRAANPPKKQSQIEHFSYPSREHQLSAVARIVLKNFSSKETVAVLARGHESLKQLASLLWALGVPVRYEQQNDILSYEAIRQIVILSRLVVAIQNGDKDKVNALLNDTLRHPMWGIDSKKLWQLSLQNWEEPDWLNSMQKSGGEIMGIASWLDWLARESAYQPLPLVMEYLIGLREGFAMTSPLREHFASKQKISSEYLQALSAIRLLRELTQEFSDNDFDRLHDFVDFIDVISSSTGSISDESVFVTDEHAVELYTVHKAKGLEFDRVYIIDCVENIWQPRTSRRKPPANLPLERPGEHRDDYTRLLYVAATRAKRDLIISSYYQDASGKDMLPTALLHEALPAKKLPASQAGEPIEVLEETLRWPRLDVSDEKQLLRGRLGEFSINVTNLLNFLDLSSGGPQYFLERNILRLPEAKTPELVLGSAVHFALQRAQELVNKGKFNVKDTLAALDEYFKREHLKSDERKHLKNKTEVFITDLFAKLEYELPKGSVTEQTITNIQFKNARIGGKLDRVDKLNEELIIIDYKTGSPLSNLNSQAKSTAIKAWKHRTQLVFYALLARYQPGLSIYKSVRGQMVYVQAKSKSQLVRDYTPSDEEIDHMEKLVEAVWAKVVSLDLPDTSKYNRDIEGIKKFEDDLIKG